MHLNPGDISEETIAGICSSEITQDLRDPDYSDE